MTNIEGPIPDILSNEYVDGKRVSQQLVVYNKSDDVLTLGNLQIQLGNALRRLEEHDDTSQPLTYWESIRNSLMAKIKVQQEYIDGYGKDVTKQEEVSNGVQTNS